MRHACNAMHAKCMQKSRRHSTTTTTPVCLGWASASPAQLSSAHCHPPATRTPPPPPLHPPPPRHLPPGNLYHLLLCLLPLLPLPGLLHPVCRGTPAPWPLRGRSGARAAQRMQHGCPALACGDQVGAAVGLLGTAALLHDITEGAALFSHSMGGWCLRSQIEGPPYRRAACAAPAAPHPTRAGWQSAARATAGPAGSGQRPARR